MAATERRRKRQKNEDEDEGKGIGDCWQRCLHAIWKQMEKKGREVWTTRSIGRALVEMY